VFGAVAALAALVFLLVVKDPPHASDVVAPAPQSFRQLMRSRDLVLVLALALLGLGIFNGLMTWLEVLLKPHGVDAEQAGLVGGALIVGGIFGAAAIPALSDLVKRRKPFVVACTAVAVMLIVPLCRGSHLPTLLALAAAFGFFFLPAYALLLEMCSELAGHASAGYATGLLMLAGNAGGVLIIEGMHATMDTKGGHGAAIGLLWGAGVVALGLSLLVSETFHARKLAVGSAQG
jgi:predicted MFS family arabinose efflux permease